MTSDTASTRIRRPVVGVLHPGAMGAALGAALKPAAAQVVWAAAERSDATAKRAELADLVAVPDLAELARRCDVILSICPPDAAWQVAEQVAAVARSRDEPPLYVDANAVAPATVERIARLFGPERVVDAAIIGPPAWGQGGTVLWLAGTRAPAVASLFAGSPFEARVLDGASLGAASALKTCFALQSKALPALWLELAAAARGFGVERELAEELVRDGVDLTAHLDRIVRRATAKAWRWAGEMDEAAVALADGGLPDGFSRAAAEVYRRMAAAVSRDAVPDADALLSALSRTTAEGDRDHPAVGDQDG